MNILPASFYLTPLFNLWRYVVSPTVVSLQMGNGDPQWFPLTFAQGQLVIGSTVS